MPDISEDRPKTLAEILDMLDQNRQQEVESYLRALNQKGLDQIAHIVTQARTLIRGAQPSKLKSYFVKTATHVLPREKVLLDLGLSLLREGQSTEALRLVDEILALKPSCVLAHAYRGKILTDQGHLQEAEEVIDKALVLDPLVTRGWFYKGNIFFKQQRFEEAIRCYQKACDLDPRFSEAWANRGYASVQLGLYYDALMCYDHACALMPDTADVFADHGLILFTLQRYDAALISYDKALKINPHYIAVLFNKGLCLATMKRYEEAAVCYEKVVALNSSYAEAWAAYGHVLGILKCFEGCLEAYDKALVLSPVNLEFWLDRGTILCEISRYPEALTCYEKALAISPENRNALAYIGFTHLRLNRPQSALHFFHQALALAPEDPEVLSSSSIAYMMLGDYKRGWKLYDYRWKCKSIHAPRHQHIPLLSDKDLISGKKILVWFEQGFGDTLQFARYIPLLERLGADVTFEVPYPLQTLLERCLPNVKIHSSQPFSSGFFDYQIPLLSLPGLLDIGLASLPDSFENLQASSQKQEQWAHWVTASDKLNIGIICSGSREHQNDANRSIPLQFFLPLSRVANLYLIQKDVRESDLDALEHSDILFLGEGIQDFEDVAAIMHHLDLIISVDTASAHLAASMKKPTWVLLSWNPDWRWLLEGETSPWYPGIRLFRQPQPGDWHSVLQDVANSVLIFRKR